MKIIETISEYNQFVEDCKSYDWVLVPTYCNGNQPVYIDNLAVLYVYVLLKDEEYMIVFNHTEGINLTETLLNNFPDSNKQFVYGKKKFKRFLDRDNVIDMDMVQYFYNNQPIEDDFDTTAHEFFTRHFEKFSNLNAIIPISKHIEKSQKICQAFLDIYDFYQNDAAFNSYNNLMLENYYAIEKNGMFVHSTQFHNKFTNGTIHNGYAFTEYNCYTTTGRPSNRYGGINYAALNKDDGSRASFISRFGEQGFMMQFDYDAYHLRLLAELIDYKFPDNISVHEHLGKYYFNKAELTEEEYNESKSISFKQLYGGIHSDYLVIPFFARVDEYTKLVWSQFKAEGYIETPVFGRKLFASFFNDLNAAKLLNYLLQAFETERNMAVIHNILLRTQSFSSKLILYTYDSFLWDFNKSDGAEFIYMIKQELEQNGKFPVKMQIGPDYHAMINVERNI
jgi:DNA polymerase I-like protein with 3'-5' exonuclease and polymerase domains